MKITIKSETIHKCGNCSNKSKIDLGKQKSGEKVKCSNCGFEEVIKFEGTEIDNGLKRLIKMVFK